MVLFDKCCCCFGLRTGALILGWLGLIYGILGLISYINIISRVDDIVKEAKGIEDENKETFRQVLKGVFSTLIGECVITMLMNIALIWGAAKNNHLLLIPWLFMKAISNILSVILIVIVSIALFATEQIGGGCALLLLGLLFMVIPIYIWLCVYSLYQRLKLEEQQKNRRNNEEIGFIATAPVPDIKPPAYTSFHNS